MSRCSICNIKVKLNYYECKCDEKKKFCSEHRYPFNHNCSIDYKKINENKLSKLNPVVKPVKLEAI
jgi:hypothetical protein